MHGEADPSDGWGRDKRNARHAAAAGLRLKPVWHILADGDLELLLANAAHVKNVPGRKTDVNDATWLSELAAHGLIRGPGSASASPDFSGSQRRARQLDHGSHNIRHRDARLLGDRLRRRDDDRLDQIELPEMQARAIFEGSHRAAAPAGAGVC